ncbi:MAG TPA: alpha/beta hydrolase [Gemmatimonadales bacterium]|nr:alpha/beta hydrolase [Gemmatimonadales bacterium]
MLVFLHEGLGSRDLWRDWPDRVAERTGCAALVYSRYGFGKSDPLTAQREPDYLDVEAYEALPEVLAHFGIDRPVLIGHSDGGTIALIHAAAGRWPVRGMVIMAPHIFIEEVTLEGIRQAKQAFTAGGLRRKLAPWHTDVDATFAGWADLWLTSEFHDWTIESRLGGITCPVLLIQGELDQYGSPEQILAIARRVSGPAEVMLLAGCGHAPHVERAEEVLGAIDRFVSET